MSLLLAAARIKGMPRVSTGCTGNAFDLTRARNQRETRLLPVQSVREMRLIRPPGVGDHTEHRKLPERVHGRVEHARCERCASHHRST
eukprot:1471529-Rhodomonas_salina.1